MCPTEENFQFDTTFMYCISVLVFLKVCRASLTSVVSLFVYVNPTVAGVPIQAP